MPKKSTLNPLKKKKLSKNGSWRIISIEDVDMLINQSTLIVRVDEQLTYDIVLFLNKSIQ